MTTTPAQPELFEQPAQPRVAPRPYQTAACDAACERLTVERSTLVVLPTGTGKTCLAGMLAERAKEAGGRTLFLAPTITLVEQTYKALRTAGFDLTSGIEQAENYVPRPLPDVTVGSVATMRGERLRRFPRDSYALVIIDEAHRAPGGTAYREILSHFAEAKVVGLSATPDRADGLAMGNVFESVAYEMTMLAVIEAGWLCPLEFRTVKTGWDPKQIKELAGEVNAGSVEKELVRSGLLHDAASTLLDLGKGRKVLAFLPTVASCKAFAVEMASRGLSSAHIDGTTPPMLRQTIFRDFRAGLLDVLTNCCVLTEGFDEPSVSVVALLSPTKSRGRLTQMIGRGTRNSAGKENCLILDFCPGRLKKGRLAAPADALAGRAGRSLLGDRAAPQTRRRRRRSIGQRRPGGHGRLRVATTPGRCSATGTGQTTRAKTPPSNAMPWPGPRTRKCGGGAWACARRGSRRCYVATGSTRTCASS